MSGFLLLPSPFLSVYGGFPTTPMVDPTLVRIKLEQVFESIAGAPLHGAWGIIKHAVDQAGAISTDDIELPLTNPYADWIGHGYFMVPAPVAGATLYAATQAASGLIDVKAKRKLGETDQLVLVVENGDATALHTVTWTFGYRLLVLGARR